MEKDMWEKQKQEQQIVEQESTMYTIYNVKKTKTKTHFIKTNHPVSSIEYTV